MPLNWAGELMTKAVKKNLGAGHSHIYNLSNVYYFNQEL